MEEEFRVLKELVSFILHLIDHCVELFSKS